MTDIIDGIKNITITDWNATIAKRIFDQQKLEVIKINDALGFNYGVNSTSLQLAAQNNCLMLMAIDKEGQTSGTFCHSKPVKTVDGLEVTALNYFGVLFKQNGVLYCKIPIEFERILDSKGLYAKLVSNVIKGSPKGSVICRLFYLDILTDSIRSQRSAARARAQAAPQAAAPSPHVRFVSNPVVVSAAAPMSVPIEEKQTISRYMPTKVVATHMPANVANLKQMSSAELVKFILTQTSYSGALACLIGDNQMDAQHINQIHEIVNETTAPSGGLSSASMNVERKSRPIGELNRPTARPTQINDPLVSEWLAILKDFITSVEEFDKDVDGTDDAVFVELINNYESAKIFVDTHPQFIGEFQKVKTMYYDRVPSEEEEIEEETGEETKNNHFGGRSYKFNRRRTSNVRIPKKKFHRRSQLKKLRKHSKNLKFARRFGDVIKSGDMYGLQSGPGYDGVYPMNFKSTAEFPNLLNVSRDYGLNGYPVY